MIIIVTDKKRQVIAVYISVVDKQQIKEGNDDRDVSFKDLFHTNSLGLYIRIAFYER